jgi:hypothetical protein
MLGKFHGKWRAGLFLSGLLVVLTVAGAFVFHLGTTPRVSTSTALWPATASPGSMILVTGTGFPAQERVQVYFQTPERGTVAALANANGSFSTLLTVPSAYSPGTQYYVYVNSDTYSTKMLFNFAKPGISLTDPTTQPTFGSPTSFTATGFKPNEKVNLMWSYTTGSTLNAGTVLTGSDGSFTTILTMPSIPHGAQGKLVATGSSSSFTASAAITEAAGLIYDPSSAAAGTTVNLKGGAFGSNELVNVSFEGAPVATVKTDATGSFATPFTVSDSNQIGYEDNAIVVNGLLSGAKAKGGFNRRPKITISPNHGGPGTRIRVTGTHFSRNAKVSISFVVHPGSSRIHGAFASASAFAPASSSIVQVPLTTMTTSPGGTFSATVTAPTGLAAVNNITAVDTNTGESATAVFLGG